MLFLLPLVLILLLRIPLLRPQAFEDEGSTVFRNVDSE
jgi:hypothetical protein